MHANGDSYRGQWVNDEKNGKGKEVWTDGTVYEGNYVNGQK